MIFTYIAGIIGGGAVGALYYKFIGCRTGTCPLMSTIYRSMVYGAVLGGLIADTFVRS